MGRAKSRDRGFDPTDPFQRYSSLRRAVAEFADRVATLRREIEEVTLGVKKGSLPKLQRELMWNIDHLGKLIKNRNEAWARIQEKVNRHE